MKSLLQRNVVEPAIRAVRRRRIEKYIGALLPSMKEVDAAVLRSCVSYNRHGGYCVPLSSRHRPAARKILAGQVWEPDTLDFIAENHAHGDIVHAGTYFGDFLPALSAACGDSGKVWAFEPNPENFRCAQVTAAINHLDNVELRNAALGAEPGTLPMVTLDALGRSLGGASRLSGESEGRGNERSVNVDVLPLDAMPLAGRHVSIIQLDVEGFEKEALTGALGTVERCKPILILENLPERAWLERNILSLGYREVGRLHANTVLRADA